MKKTILTLTLLSSLAFATERPITVTERAWLMDNKIEKQIDFVTHTELKKMIEKDSIVLIDLRNPDIWKDGVIEAKRLVKYPQDYLIVKYIKPISSNYDWKKTDFIVYCQSNERSILAARRLKELGFTNMRYLEGGYDKWVK